MDNVYTLTSMDAQYELRGQTFEWDLEKAAANLLKHRVAFETACEVFFDPFLVLVVPATMRSHGMRRSG